MRRHLFGGWPLLTFLAARAREGKLQIYVPWIIHQEIVTGIRDQVEELTARKQLDAGLSEIAKGSATLTSLAALESAVRETRERLYTETKTRYEHWLRSSQAEILPLTIEETTAAWQAYFAGTTPFRRVKSRSDLPDAFAFQALVALSEKVGEVHFIVEDKPFRDGLAGVPNLSCHKDVYAFCSGHGLAIDVRHETALQKRELPLERIAADANAVLQKKMLGLKLRVPAESSIAAERLQIEAVRTVDTVAVDAQSVIHIAEDDYLIGFRCAATLQCTNADEGGEQSDSANYRVSIIGHLLVRIPLAASIPSSADLDSIEAETIALAEDQELITIVQPPEFRTKRWFERYVEAITRPGRSGLVVVVGSNQIARRRVAEHLFRMRQRRDPDLGALYLTSFGPEFTNSLLHVTSCSTRIGDNDVFERARDASAKALAVSLENDRWVESAVGFAIRNDAFVIATMKNITSVSGVVRELYRIERDVGLETLLGVAVVMNVQPRRIQFRATTYGEWGDGSWWGILEHDEWVKGYQR
jgi:hypothetical protein